ncbi:MAG: methyltransferase domain-containing protein [Ferruginibacter sp.]
MVNLSKRSNKKEILDGENIPFADIKQNLEELNTINTTLGGHKITLDGIKAFTNKHKNSPFTFCEIGCGGGDNLKAISTWCGKNKISANFIGIDIKKECLDYATKQYPELKAEWIQDDYYSVNFINRQPDVIFSSLFCHHFTETELIKMLHWMQANCSKGFFINDLQRNSIAYYGIKFITWLFSKSYLVKNDAPLSVARGFTKNEWQSIFKKAGISHYSIQWKWAFRYLIITDSIPENIQT